MLKAGKRLLEPERVTVQGTQEFVGPHPQPHQGASAELINVLEIIFVHKAL